QRVRVDAILGGEVEIAAKAGRLGYGRIQGEGGRRRPVDILKQVGRQQHAILKGLKRGAGGRRGDRAHRGFAPPPSSPPFCEHGFSLGTEIGAGAGSGVDEGYTPSKPRKTRASGWPGKMWNVGGARATSGPLRPRECLLLDSSPVERGGGQVGKKVVGRPSARYPTSPQR